jgi:hypothetical protein
MPYLDDEISVHDGKPIELYKFVGTYANFFYTSGPKLVDFLGDDYIPLAIKRSEVKSGTQEDDGLDLSIELPASSDLAQTYGFSETPPELTLTVYRYHRGAPGDYVVYWIGPVTNINTTAGVSQIRSPSALSYSLSGNLPNVYYQSPCNHTLFDPRCGVLEEDWAELTTANAIDGREITVLSVGALDGLLIGGEISLASGERRMIVGQAGTVLTVNFPFFGLTPPAAVSLVPGCDYAYLGDCSATKFNNQPRFGGMPFIPDENIFESGMEPGTTAIDDNTCLPSTWSPVYPGWDYEIEIRAIYTHAKTREAMLMHGPSGNISTPNMSAFDYDEVIRTAPLTNRFIRRVSESDAPYFAAVGTGVGTWDCTFDPTAVNYVPGVTNRLRTEVYFRHWTEEFAQLVGEHDYTTNSGARYFEWECAIAWDDWR